jgi:maleylpyruvate isomerase
MRAEELWVHGADLRAGLALADLPADFCVALVDDVLGLFDRTWGSGRQSVEGPVAAVAAWLRCADSSGLARDAPPLPSWL